MPECQNSSHHSTVWEECIFLHRLPTDSRRSDWLSFINLHRKDFAASASNTFVCSRHFTDADYENKMEFVLMAKRGSKIM